MFQIDLSSEGDFILYHNNQHVEISATPVGVEYIKKVIYEHKRGIRNQPGYIGTFPTQHAVNKFLKEKNQRLAKEKAEDERNKLEEKTKKLGIDLKELNFNL